MRLLLIVAVVVIVAALLLSRKSAAASSSTAPVDYNSPAPSENELDQLAAAEQAMQDAQQQDDGGFPVQMEDGTTLILHGDPNDFLGKIFGPDGIEIPLAPARPLASGSY